MSDSQLQTILSEQNVAKDNANQLLAAFGAPFEDAGLILSSYKDIKVTEEDDFTTMAEARTKRLALKNIRVDVEKKRKELKEDSLKVGRAIDSVARYVKDTIEPAEKYLESQEKFGEIKAAERVAVKKADRIEKLMAYTDDISMYNFEAMNDEQFDSLLSSLNAQKKAAEVEAKKIEEDRIAAEKAERERQIAIEAENKRLKEEADKKEKANAEEREKIRIEHEKNVAAERAVALAEREKREKLEAEQKAKQEEEARLKSESEESQRQSLLAPDKEKLLNLAAEIEKMTLPALQSKDAQAVLNEVEGLLGKVTSYIRGNVKGL